MRATVACLVLPAALALAVAPATPQTRQPLRAQYSPLAAQQGQHPHEQPQTWYEFALSRLNSANVNYGASIEERRHAFLEATVKNPYFNYALSVTLLALLLMAACAKLVIDTKRSDWMTAEMMTDLMNHEGRSTGSRPGGDPEIQRPHRALQPCGGSAGVWACHSRERLQRGAPHHQAAGDGCEARRDNERARQA